MLKGLKKIKHYRLLKLIGKGSVGDVFEAIDDNTQKTFAIKSISSKIMTDSRVFESFRKELKLLHNLNHENVIKIYGIEKTPNNLYLILEFANGGNLFEYLTFYTKKHGVPIPESIVQFIIRQVAKGLEHIHEKNIIHRDIKLENILLHFPLADTNSVDYNNVNIDEAIIKIADLGYGKETLDNKTAETFCGTPMCMAPELVNVYDCYNSNQPITQYNAKVDMWALGTVTYELTFGVQPFPGKSLVELFGKIKSGKCLIQSKLKKNISIEILLFLNGLLQFDSSLRFGWDIIRNHSFILSKERNFNYIDITLVDPHSNLNLLDDPETMKNLLMLFQKPVVKEKLEKPEIIDDLVQVKNNISPSKEVAKEVIFTSQMKRPASESFYEDAKETLGSDILKKPTNSNNVVSNLINNKTKDMNIFSSNANEKVTANHENDGIIVEVNGPTLPKNDDQEKLSIVLKDVSKVSNREKEDTIQLEYSENEMNRKNPMLRESKMLEPKRGCSIESNEKTKNYSIKNNGIDSFQEKLDKIVIVKEDDYDMDWERISTESIDLFELDKEDLVEVCLTDEFEINHNFFI